MQSMSTHISQTHTHTPIHNKSRLPSSLAIIHALTLFVLCVHNTVGQFTQCSILAYSVLCDGSSIALAIYTKAK